MRYLTFFGDPSFLDIVRHLEARRPVLTSIAPKTSNLTLCSQEYFSSTVGPVKKVLLNYTKVGRSTGVANIIFSQPNSAAEAAKAYNGVKVDGRPMKVYFSSPDMPRVRLTFD